MTKLQILLNIFIVSIAVSILYFHNQPQSSQNKTTQEQTQTTQKEESKPNQKQDAKYSAKDVKKNSQTQSMPPTVEDGVYVLTDMNYQEFIQKHEYVLIELYAPWCGHCKQLAPEYAKAAQALANKNSTIVLAKVDATEQKKIAQLFKVQGFPTLKLVNNGDLNNLINFSARTEDKILASLEKKTEKHSLKVESQQQLDELKEKSEVMFVYFGNPEQEQTQWSVFKNAAQNYDDFIFAYIDNEEIRKNENAQNFRVVLYKQFDNKRDDFLSSRPFLNSNFKDFLENSSTPLLLKYNDRGIDKVFAKKNPALILFTNDLNSEVALIFRQAAEENKTKNNNVLFSVCQPGEEIHEKLSNYVGVDPLKIPNLILVNQQKDLDKYQFSQEFTKENILDFIVQFKQGKLKKYIKSQPIPEKNNENVVTLVGNTFEDMVIKSEKDVLVEFYAPWCGHCKKLEPIYEELARKLKDNSNLVLAKIDATNNEIAGIQINGYPSIKFYAKGKKKTPIDHEGNREEKDIIEFIKKHTTYPWVEPQQEEQKKEQQQEKKEDI
ncbi:prolyl 4- beta polypeptide, putative [Ichthyophthirius multifiliis]|uniref:Protein disulfide-isomerase n=1 Tax=Ichthyophthirius multifiliis TaxID=5932 RepID=G0QPR8_ICHMU|nr:prolyl 4- beta polypeptide, putative [Ichthyophthirius multifiliis]EGR32783.1 prolyl 4- beta polypeptide, putative [Ichthyophthirius multifiliis]|eukprot:XP_004036769.1 prolyl 4- beta polypeptide, putative [Ichthyophthirius multifiliis]